MSEAGVGLDLARTRDLGTLLSDSFRVMRDHPGAILTIAAAIVVPVHLVVSGIGLERLTSPYWDDPGRAEQLIPTVVSFFVIAPLVAAATIHMLQAVADGGRPRAAAYLQGGLDAFAPLFLAVLISAAGNSGAKASSPPWRQPAARGAPKTTGPRPADRAPW